MWRGFVAGAFADPTKRDKVFDMFCGTVDKVPDDNTIEDTGDAPTKVTAESFKRMTQEQKKKLYEDIIRQVKGRSYESK